MTSVLPLFLLVGEVGTLPLGEAINDVSIVYQCNTPITRALVSSNIDITSDLAFNISTHNDYFAFETTEAQYIVGYSVGITTTQITNFSRDSTENMRSLRENWLFYDNVVQVVENNGLDRQFTYNMTIQDSSITEALNNDQTLYFYFSVDYSSSMELTNWGDGFFDINVMNYVIGSEYQDGYENGLVSGYNNGYDTGYQDGSTSGYNSGYTNGYNKGYQDGYDYTENLDDYSVQSMLMTILDYPLKLVKDVTNVELFGVNLYSVITFVLSITLIAFVIKYFI